MCPQAAFKYWLGVDHYINTIRKSTAGFQGLFGSDPESVWVFPGVRVSDATFAGVPVRVYEPLTGGQGQLRRGLVFLHGGGWALGSASEFKKTRKSVVFAH